jgi:excinuclease ABC subunit C
MEFEKAAVARDQLAALETSIEKQRVASHATDNRDVVGYHEERGQAAIVLLFYRDGQLVESSNWAVAVHGESSAKSLSQFLGQYYGENRFLPPEILLPFAPEDARLIEEWLSELRGGRVELIVPRRGEKLRVVEMAGTNAREILARKLSDKRETEEMLEDLADRLRLEAPPRAIECYDVATLQGSQSVGAQVAFADGEPNKAGYRLYRIRGVEGVDDFAMMREVLTRRFRRALEENQDLPDLVVVDGGKGQLAVAVEVLQEFGIDSVGLAALAKSRLRLAGKPRRSGEEKDESDERDGRDEGDGSEERVRTPEHLFIPGRKNPVVFPPHAPSFYLLQRLRDEAHRFVNTFHAKRRGKAYVRSTLEEVEGIGPRRARALLRHFGSLARVREADVEALAAAPTMNAPAARRLFDALHPGGGLNDTGPNA